jgi:predicted Mrr-cat superfamily restriction endonuclease
MHSLNSKILQDGSMPLLVVSHFPPIWSTALSLQDISGLCTFPMIHQKYFEDIVITPKIKQKYYVGRIQSQLDMTNRQNTRIYFTFRIHSNDGKHGYINYQDFERNEETLAFFEFAKSNNFEENTETGKLTLLRPYFHVPLKKESMSTTAYNKKMNQAIRNAIIIREKSPFKIFDVKCIGATTGHRNI